MNDLNGFIIFDGEYIPKSFKNVVQVDFYNMGSSNMVSIISNEDGKLRKMNYDMSEISQMTVCVRKE